MTGTGRKKTEAYLYEVTLKEAEFPAQDDQPIFDTTIGDILRAQALRLPDRTAVAEAASGDGRPGQLSRSLTYAELLAEAEQLASSLLSRYQSGERVAIWAPNCLEWIVFEFACALAGLPFVTANPSSQARELDYVLRQSKAVGLFTVQQYRGNPMWQIATEVVTAHPQVRDLVDLDDRDSLFKDASPSASLPMVAAGDPAMIIYTSGTTGNPKGVILSHRGVTNNSRLVFQRLAPPAGRAIVTAAPFFHIGSCAVGLLGAVQQGIPLILLTMFDPALVLDLIEVQKAGVFTGVPTMLHGAIEQQEARPRNVSSLETVLCGGAMIAPELIRRSRETLGCGVQNIYGQTEVSGVLSQTHLTDAVADTSETVGQALPMTEISIRDPASGATMAAGEVGEICARGFGVMLGYNDNPEATASAIDKEGWLHTGDLGTMDGRGYVRITGRVKEMIIRGGENIYPAEIENVLLEHPDVTDVAVVGIPDPRWGEIVGCFLRIAPGASLDEAALVAHCRAAISAQKTPSRWVTVESWPLTGSGKIQKFALRDKLLAGEFD